MHLIPSVRATNVQFPVLLKVWFADGCQLANCSLLVHHQMKREIESKHLETFYSSQSNFMSNESNTNQK